MVSFTKFGSCVARDIFNFLDNELYRVNCTVTGQTIEAIKYEEDLKISEEDIIGDSNFDKRMVAGCYDGTHLKKLFANQSDYFIMDLADERLPMQRYSYNDIEKNVPVTWSTYRTVQNLKATGRYSNLEISDWHLSDRNIASYDKDIISFCNIVKAKYDTKKIIYISLRQAYEFIDPDSGIQSFDDYETNGIEKRKLREHQDKVIEHAEEIFKRNMPGIWVIEMPGNAIADCRHHLGTHTLHFNHLLYEYFAKCIMLVAKTRDYELTDKEIRDINKNMAFYKRYAEIKFEELKRIYRV